MKYKELPQKKLVKSSKLCKTWRPKPVGYVSNKSVKTTCE